VISRNAFPQTSFRPAAATFPTAFSTAPMPQPESNQSFPFDEANAAANALPGAGWTLSEEDARVLDLLVDGGWDPAVVAALPADDRARAERILALLGPLEVTESESTDGADAETLINATLARVDQADADRRDRMRFDPVGATASRRRTVRFPDLIAVASIALLAAVVLVPMVHWRNARALDTACENNLRLIAQGIHAYTESFAGAMPMTAGLLPGLLSSGGSTDAGSWIGYRNSDHLNALKDGQYCSSRCLCCPGDHAIGTEDGCYAYQVTTAERPLRWQTGPTTAVVGDRNPLVDLKRHGESIGSVALNSASHGGRGQNLLFSDGAVRFSNSPYLTIREGLETPAIDNIWLPFGDHAESLNDRPAFGPRRGVDAFLLH
jgi:hypothetical protein